MSKNAQTGMIDVPKYGDLRDLMVSKDTRAARQKAVDVAEKVVQNRLHEDTDENWLTEHKNHGSVTPKPLNRGWLTLPWFLLYNILTSFK